MLIRASSEFPRSLQYLNGFFFSVCRVLVNVGIEHVVVRNIPSPILQIPQRDDMNTSMYAEIGAAAL